MKSIAKNCYKDNLDKKVKEQLKLLNVLDNLERELKQVIDKQKLLDGDESPTSLKELRKLEDELRELQLHLGELTRKLEEASKMTPKETRPAD